MVVHVFGWTDAFLRETMCRRNTHIKMRFVYFEYMYTICSLYGSVLCKAGELTMNKNEL